jgi:uncharacterized membrane protein
MDDDARRLPGRSIGAAIRTALRWLLAAFYAVAGWAHLDRPEGFLAITPAWVPAPELVVALTGVAEIAGALGLLWRPVRRWAGIGLALYALFVWPANFNHAFNDISIGGTNLDWSYHGPRLVAQPLIIWLALWVGEVTEWPFGATKPRLP